METKRTPTPWYRSVKLRVRSELHMVGPTELLPTADQFYVADILREDGHSVARLQDAHHVEGAPTAEETDRYAKLFAAAPEATTQRDELLEALKVIVEMDDDGFTSDGHERCVEIAERAIAKATGAA